MSSNRTFIVRVSDSPSRVVVEDVRERRRAVTDDLSGVGPQIAAWLAASADELLDDLGRAAREDSVSPPP